MSLKVSAYFAASVDGSIDWLNEASSSVPKGEDCGYKAFMDPVDVLNTEGTDMCAGVTPDV